MNKEENSTRLIRQYSETCDVPYMETIVQLWFVPNLKKAIDIELLEEANQYFNSLPEKIQLKLFKAFDKTKIGLKGQWFKSIGDDIWEFRTRDSQKFYRLLAFWDKTGETETLIVATHGFNKKTNKTPKAQKDRAQRIRTEYFNK